MIRNGMMIVNDGRVSVLVFEKPEQRKCIGELLTNAADHITCIAVAPDEATEAELESAIDHAVHERWRSQMFDRLTAKIEESFVERFNVYEAAMKALREGRSLVTTKGASVGWTEAPLAPLYSKIRREAFAEAAEIAKRVQCCGNACTVTPNAIREAGK